MDNNSATQNSSRRVHRWRILFNFALQGLPLPVTSDEPIHLHLPQFYHSFPIPNSRDAIITGFEHTMVGRSQLKLLSDSVHLKSIGYAAENCTGYQPFILVFFYLDSDVRDHIVSTNSWPSSVDQLRSDFQPDRRSSTRL
ncbi:hypothetical protein CY34DRAFT_812445 [Suillus luteus UH-Slu-Lm8-n1]|uniref:Uncharacterized protein n=1 Tax=Suillus luteus UH-Slu-Lm8-n1 TaxID=930992 RepID=A0A0D0ALD2_9AGAM|nr:hypothetical protein CY34DRAFT_812445 [Suillus luteus UH-Slu-Lm8-n1]